MVMVDNHGSTWTMLCFHFLAVARGRLFYFGVGVPRFQPHCYRAAWSNGLFYHTRGWRVYPVGVPDDCLAGGASFHGVECPRCYFPTFDIRYHIYFVFAEFFCRFSPPFLINFVNIICLIYKQIILLIFANVKRKTKTFGYFSLNLL